MAEEKTVASEETVLLDPDTLDPSEFALSSTARLGDCVLLLDSGRKWNSVILGSKMKQKLGATRSIELRPLIDKRYGSAFELFKSSLKEMNSEDWRPLGEDEIDSLPTNESDLFSADNSQLFAGNESVQTLTQSEILSMKHSGDTTADEMVAKIAESSKTFEQKTLFSQQKYIKKKKCKYAQKYVMLEANGWNIAEMYFTKKPDKTLALRLDALSQILTLANVHCNQQILMVENCTGLVLAAAAERMGGRGRILHGYTDKYPSVNIATSMCHLTAAEKSVIVNFHLGLIADTTLTEVQLLNTVDSSSKPKMYKRPNLKTIKTWLETDKCDSLILCCKYEILSLLQRLWPYLDDGCPFVVWSQQCENLTTVMDYLREQRCVVNLRLHDNWFREYQILPHRTHPRMNMHQLGGYLLSGIKVIPPPPIPLYNNVDTSTDATPVPMPPSKKQRLI